MQHYFHFTEKKTGAKRGKLKVISIFHGLDIVWDFHTGFFLFLNYHKNEYQLTEEAQTRVSQEVIKLVGGRARPGVQVFCGFFH